MDGYWFVIQGNFFSSCNPGSAAFIALLASTGQRHVPSGLGTGGQRWMGMNSYLKKGTLQTIERGELANFTVIFAVFFNRRFSCQ